MKIGTMLGQGLSKKELTETDRIYLCSWKAHPKTFRITTCEHSKLIVIKYKCVVPISR